MLTLPCLDGASAQQTELPEDLRHIAALHVEGGRGVPRRALRTANLKTRRPSRLPWRPRPALRVDYLRSDTTTIAALYRHYGYLDAHVTWRIASTDDPTAARVTFVIDQGAVARVGDVTFDGVEAYPEKQLRSGLLARPKRVYDPAYLQLDTLKISSLYQERGYLPSTLASASRREPDSLVVDVHYQVSEGRPFDIGEQYVLRRGPGGSVDPRVPERIALRELLVKPGDRYRRSRVQRSIERLYETGLWSQVQVTPLPDSSTSTIHLDMRLGERKPRWFDAGVGSGTSERFRLEGGWGHRNLLGRALSTEITSRVAFDETGRFSIGGGRATLLDPWLGGVRVRGSAGVFWERADFRADPRFVRHEYSYGVLFGVSHELSRISRITLQQVNSFVRQRYDRRDSLFAQIPADSVLSSYRRNTLLLTVQRDMRDNRVIANRGSFQTASGELAGGFLRGQSNYWKYTMQSQWWTPLPNGWTFAARAIGGVIRPYGPIPTDFSPEADLDAELQRVPLETRFRLGGVNSLRGYDEGAIPVSGGLAMVQSTIEMRIPIVGPLGAEFFVDTGNAWDRPEYVKARDFIPRLGGDPPRRGDLRTTFGVGGRLNLPFGPLRVDFAWNDRPDVDGRRLRHVFQFAIGPSF